MQGQGLTSLQYSLYMLTINVLVGAAVHGQSDRQIDTDTMCHTATCFDV